MRPRMSLRQVGPSMMISSERLDDVDDLSVEMVITDCDFIHEY